MGSYESVILEMDRAKNIARIMLNQPENLNVWGFPGQGGLIDDFYAALTEAEDDDDIKVIIIKGAGRAFSAGHDLNKVGFIYGMGTGQPGERRPSERIRLEVDRKWFDRLHHLFTCRKVTIAQVHGYCVGEGLLLVELCDLAVAAEDAQLGHYDQRLGFAGSGTPTLLHLIFNVGLKRAMEMLLTGDSIDGKEAARIGLVNKAVPYEKLEEEVEELAARICLQPRDGIALGKAHRHILYDQLGLSSSGFSLGYYAHSFFTNLRWESDEYNFFKERRDKGTKVAYHTRDERY